MTTPNTPKFWLEPLYRIAALEYALIEACHAAAPGAHEDDQARLASRAGAAQVHLFDLGTALHDLGEDSISYARCMRSALMFNGTQAELLSRLVELGLVRPRADRFDRHQFRLLFLTFPQGLKVIVGRLGHSFPPSENLRASRAFRR